ncbi:MAG: hypothetical protein ACTSYK_02830 [Alphaproteobacteria bacterium]|jgi:hypothetical protein
MPTTLTLAVVVSLFLPVQAVKQPPTAPPDQLNTGRASLEDVNLARGA